MPREESAQLPARLNQVRCTVFGKDGIPAIAESPGLPPQVWIAYEDGEAIPGMILLGFVDLTGVRPEWLLHGEGPLHQGRKQSERRIDR